MKAGKETELYNQGYMDGYDDAEKAHVDPIVPKLKGSGPDYWTRLEHQYAGMAMQGMMAHTNIDYDDIVDLCVEFARALVEKYKKEERK